MTDFNETNVTFGDPSRVDSRITDAVTQANVKVLADAPAMAMGTMYQSLANATGIAFSNAVSTQQRQDTAASAATTQGVTQLFLVDTIGEALAGAKLTESDEGEYMSSLLAVIRAFASQGTSG